MSLKTALKRALHSSGVSSSLARRDGASFILAAHIVLEEEAEQLADVIRLLQRSFSLVSLDEYLDALRAGRCRNLVTLTFDDGLRNQLTVAHDVLVSLRVPATFYVCPALVGTPFSTWTWELEPRLSRMSTRRQQEIFASGSADSFEPFLQTLKEMPLGRREAIWTEIVNTTPEFVFTPDEERRYSLMDWAELGKLGLEVHVAARSDCPAFRSRWATRTLIQPSTSDSQRFIRWLRTLPDEYALVIPATGYSLHHLARLDESDPLREALVLPAPEALHTALDKARTLDRAIRLGISVPSSSLRTRRDAAENGPLPRVLKPTCSVLEGSHDLTEVFPTLVRDAEQRKEALERLLQKCPVLEQELVPGVGIGIECLYARGKLLWHFAHERLHEGTGGGLGSGSFYRKSIPAPPDLLWAAKRLLDVLGWHGVAMVEFKYDRESGRYWLMEINPRLWGSVALAIDAGVDFPYGLFCIATDADPGPQPLYRQRYYTRLVPPDLDWIARQIRTSGASRAVELLSFLRLLTGRESWDHFAWTDLGPLVKSSTDFLREK